MRSILLSALLTLHFVYMGGAQKPTVTVTNAAGNAVQPSSFLEEGTAIRISCNWVLSGTHRLTIHYLNTSDSLTRGDINLLTGCGIFAEGGSPEPFEDALFGTACDNNGITITYTLGDVTPYSFFCQDEYIKATLSQTSDYFLAPKTYVTPLVLTVHSPAESETGMIEYTTQVFACSSEARPPPRMQLRLGGQLQQVSQLPPVDSITEDSPFGKSNASWSVNVTRTMNGMALDCSMEHESGAELSKSISLAVFYGPDNETTRAEQTFNLEEAVDPIEVACGLSSNPPASVFWYKNSLSNPVPTSDVENGNLILKLSDYPELIMGMVETNNYTCKAEANGQVGYKTITVSVTRLEITTTMLPTTAERTTVIIPSKGLLKLAGVNWWVWLIVGIVGLLIVAAVIIICVIVYKRKATSSPEKKKKKIAKEGDSKKGPGNSSLSDPQPELVRTNYNGDPGRNSQNYDDWSKAGTIDANPRSRRPIALNEFDNLEGPAPEGGPPAYNGHEFYPTNTYSSSDPQYSNTYVHHHAGSPQESYDMGYGAPC